MNIDTVFDTMTHLAHSCIALKQSERPELQWLNEKYQKLIQQVGLKNRGAADQYIYAQIYHKPPENLQDIIKIRYWRTGRHLPVNYALCAAFGKAMHLDDAGQRFLMQGYYDSCDQMYAEEPSNKASAYWGRRNSMERLVNAYLKRIPLTRLAQLKIQSEMRCHNLRHLYYADAMHYVQESDTVRRKYLSKHITSINYDSELNRTVKLLGVVPRKTMLRHLIILGMPNVTQTWLNAALKQFGYLPLDERHTMRNGERLDWLLIRLLQWYEGLAGGAEERLGSFQQACRILDSIFAAEKEPGLRFMYFKALGHRI